MVVSYRYSDFALSDHNAPFIQFPLDTHSDTKPKNPSKFLKEFFPEKSVVPFVNSSRSNLESLSLDIDIN